MLSLLFFITNFVGSIVYDGSPEAKYNSKERKNYDEGIQMGLVCQGIGFGSLLFFLFSYSVNILINFKLEQFMLVSMS